MAQEAEVVTQPVEQTETAGVVIDDKVQPIAIESATDLEPELNEDDPRTAIYKKHAEKRREELGKPAIDEPAKEDPAPDEDVIVKVNGKERKVPKSKIDDAGGVVAYQKQAAASEALNQANAELKRVRDLESQVNARAAELEQQRVQQQTQQRPVQQPAASPPTPDAMKDMARKYHEAIMDGDMDAADELLVKMQTARSGATNDIETIANQAAEKVNQTIEAKNQAKAKAEFEKSRAEGMTEFEGTYADVASDPELRTLADQKTIELRREHPDWDPKTVIVEAAQSVRKWAAGKGLVSVGNDKLEAKRQQTTVRGGTARVIPRPAPQPQSKSKYVEELRKSRGLE